MTSLTDLIVSVGTDAALIAGIFSLYLLLRKQMRSIVREEIAEAVQEANEAEHGPHGRMPRDEFDEMGEHIAANSEAINDLRMELRGVSSRLDTLRTLFFSHVDRSHR